MRGGDSTFAVLALLLSPFFLGLAPCHRTKSTMVGVQRRARRLNSVETGRRSALETTFGSLRIKGEGQNRDSSKSKSSKIKGVYYPEPASSSFVACSKGYFSYLSNRAYGSKSSKSKGGYPNLPSHYYYDCVAEETETVYNAYIIANKVGLTASDLQSGPYREALDKAYAAFIARQVTIFSSHLSSTYKVAIKLVLGSAKNYQLVDVECPHGFVGNCQKVYASFQYQAFGTGDASAITSALTIRTQYLIPRSPDGLNTYMVAYNPHTPIRVISSCEPLRPPEGPPTPRPTLRPTLPPVPTESPTSSPTRVPTIGTKAPSREPTRMPSPSPTELPTFNPTLQPTVKTDFPTFNPTAMPTDQTPSPTSSTMEPTSQTAPPTPSGQPVTLPPVETPSPSRSSQPIGSPEPSFAAPATAAPSSSLRPTPAPTSPAPTSTFRPTLAPTATSRPTTTSAPSSFVITPDPTSLPTPVSSGNETSLPTSLPAPLPTHSPTTTFSPTTQGDLQSCNICGDGNFIGDLNGEISFIDNEGFPRRFSCGQLQDLIDQGVFVVYPGFCPEIQIITPGPCLCKSLTQGPTPVPVPSASLAPTPALVPTFSPAPTTTAAPSPGTPQPTQTLSPTAGSTQVSTTLSPAPTTTLSPTSVDTVVSTTNSPAPTFTAAPTVSATQEATTTSPAPSAVLSPTSSPAPTTGGSSPAPTAAGSSGTSFKLTPFELSYVGAGGGRVPLPVEFQEVADLTNVHLKSVFDATLGEPDIQTETISLGQEIRNGEIKVLYETTVTSASDNSLDPANFDEIQGFGFIGSELQSYLDELNALPDNILSESTAVVYALRPDLVQPASVSQVSSTQVALVVAVSSAGALLVLGVAYIGFRHRALGQTEKIDFQEVASETEEDSSNRNEEMDKLVQIRSTASVGNTSLGSLSRESHCSVGMRSRASRRSVTNDQEYIFLQEDD